MNRRERIAAVTLWSLSGLLLAGSWIVAEINHPGRTWGLDGFRFLGMPLRLTLTGGGVALAVVVALIALQAKGVLARFIPWMILAGFFLAMLLFPPATFLRGDGQLLIDAVRSHRLLPLRAPLTSLITDGLSRIPAFGDHPERVFRGLGLLGGLLHLWAIVLILRDWKNVAGKIAAALLLTRTGALLLYVGLAEYYALVAGAVVLAMALSLRPLREGRFPRAGFLVAILASFFHIMGVVLLPAFVLALTPRLGRRWSRLLFALVAVLGMAVALVFARAHMMAPFGPALHGSAFAAWGRRLLDDVNLLFWMAPGAAVLLPAWLLLRREQNVATEERSTREFLVGAFLGTVGFLLLFKPDLGAARDADLYVVFGLMLLLLTLELFRGADRRILAHASGAILLAGIVTVGAQLMVQANESESIQRHRRLLELDPTANVAYGWEFLGQHYLEQGRYPEARQAYTQAWEASKNPRYTIALSTLALQFHRADQAEQWARIAVKAFPGNAEAQASLGAALYAQGKIADSAEPLEKALRGGLADPTLVLLLGDAWVRVGRAADAVQLLDSAFRSGLHATGNLLTVMAQAQEALDHEELAAKLYDQALQLHVQEPFRSRAREGRSRLGSLLRSTPSNP